MAGKRKKRTAKPPRRRGSGRPRRRPPSLRKTTPLDLVVSGLKSVVSLLPGGKFLTDLADVFFTSVARPISGSISAFGTFEGTVAIYGMGTMFAINYVNILAHSTRAIINMNVGGKYNYATNYQRARVLEFAVTVRADNPVAKRSGRWGMAMIPFSHVNDLSLYFGSNGNYKIPTFTSISNVPLNIVGDMTQSLTLRYTPKPYDGHCYHYNQVTDHFAVIMIAYQEENRTTYTEFSAEEFSPDIRLSGKIALREPTSDASSREFVDEIWNSPLDKEGKRTATPRLALQTTEQMQLLNSAGLPIDTAYYSTFDCKSTKDGLCQITKTLFSNRTPMELQLDKLELDDLAM